MLHLVYGNPLERSDSGDILCDRISWKRWKSGRQTSNIARQSRTFLDWIRTAIRDKWTGNDIVGMRRGRREDDWRHTHAHTRTQHGIFLLQRATPTRQQQSRLTGRFPARRRRRHYAGGHVIAFQFVLHTSPTT